MNSVLDTAREALTGNTVSRLSSLLHENEGSTRKVFEQAVPVSVAGLASSASTEAGAQALLRTFEKADYSRFDPGDLGRTVADPGAVERVASSGEGLASRLFGNKLGGVVDGLAGESGVDRSSAAKLLGLAMPLVMGIVGKQAATRHLDARGLSGFLGEQARLAGGAIPGRLAGMFGLTPAMAGGPVTAGYHPDRMVEVPYERRPHRARGGSILPYLVAALAVFAGLMWLTARRQQHHRPGAARTVATAPATPTPAPVIRPSQNVPVTGTAPEQQPAPTAVQNQGATQAPAPTAAPTQATPAPAVSAGALASALDGNQTLPARFTVPELTFRYNSATIDTSSTRVLDQVATALVAHPSAKVRIEEHTDSTGSDEANKALSQERSESVKTYLTEHGVSADQLETAGLGASRPVADNDTVQGRAQNRRTELVVTER
jgi:outer membrane protein OmpA-like peptidoglycan-associated protein